MKKDNKNQKESIIIYKDKSKDVVLHLDKNRDTIWATQAEIAEIFKIDRSVVTKHINNIFSDNEVDEKSNVQKMHIANSDKPVALYNLDVIISVGYRVKSIQGTQFRQWATKRLKDYLIEGVAINEKRLAQKNKEIQVLHDGIRILSRAIENQAANNENYAWLYQFSVGLQLLDDYDHESLDAKGNHTTKAEYPDMSEYMKLVDQMRAEFNSDVFGREKDGGFDSAVNQIMQGFGEQDAYPSIEEKAAMLLYLVVKNHAFVDGNKRIAAACFLLFLERNSLLYTNAGQTIISNEALASLTLFVAASKADEIEKEKKLLISVLNRNSK
jgi:prophage maintenance system killer protein